MKKSLARRGFLKGTAVGAAAAVVPLPAKAQTPQPSAAPAPLSKAAETQTPPALEVLTADRPGSDFMVDILKSLDIEYVCANPGSSFRGLHESLVNYGGNKNPELITCCHEEASVAMAHGYAKIEGKPLAVMLHGTGRPAARRDGDLQRLLRPRAHRLAGRQRARRHAAPPRSRMGAQRARRRRHGARFRQVGRRAHFAHAFRRVHRARLQDRDDAADDAGADRGRRRSAGASHGSGAAARSQTPRDVAAARRFRRRRRSRAPVGRRAEPGAGRRPRRAHARRHETAGGARRNLASARDRSMGTPEFPRAPSAESHGQRAGTDRQRRRHSRTRTHGLLGHRQRLSRSAGPHFALHHQAGSEAHQHHRRRPLRQGQHAGPAALSRSRSRHRSRCRSHAAVADRSRQTPAHRRSQERLRGPRRETRRRAPAASRASAHRRHLRLGREPHQHRAPLRRTVRTNQE